MCLGAQARAANKRAQKNYEYQLQKREADWMQTLSITNTERIMYEQGVQASNLGLAQVYGDIQAKYGDQIGEALQQDESNWKEFLQKSGNLEASGRTGRSIDRISTADLAGYLAKSSRKAFELTEGKAEMDAEGQQAAGAARAEQMQMFAKNAIVRNPNLAPPTPVKQNVGAAMFTDALKIAGSAAQIYTGIKLAGSDRRLKENIQKIGESISGLGIYKFNYIGKAKQYIGAMADEVSKVVPEAVVTMDNGYLGVNYDLIDVEFKEA